MARFIMSNRRAGKYRQEEKLKSREALENTWEKHFNRSADTVKSSEPKDEARRRVIHFDSEPGEVAEKIKQVPHDVLVEPEIRHTHRPRPLVLPAPQAAAPPTPSTPVDEAPQELKVHVTGEGKNVRGAEVTLVLAGKAGGVQQLTKVTNAAGNVAFDFDGSQWSLGAVTVAPAGRFWSMVNTGAGPVVNIDCPRLSADGPLAWWHRVVNVKEYDQKRGSGIKVGVIDTGCGPHPCLKHVQNLGSIIQGTHDPKGGADVDIHGTHVCGLLAARPVKAGQYAGVAPGLTVMSLRVFPPGDAGANQGDVAEAIDMLSKDHQADLLNLSIFADSASQIEHDAIIDAFERGTLCVGASGNTAGAIAFPAAFPEVASVGALGLKDWGPAGSITAALLPQDPDRIGDDNLFVPMFSNFGAALGCAAPGVGLISTFPERFGLRAPYADLAGTSCAAPVVGATLATVLRNLNKYMVAIRDRRRAELAKQALFDACRNIGLPPALRGHGLPQAADSVS